MTAPAVPPVRPPRPRLVTVAFWLQLAAAGVLLVLAGLVAWQAVRWNGEIDRALRLVPDADPAEVSDERFGNVMMACVFGVPALLLAAAFATTAFGVRRGGNISRIVVFVIAGVQLLIMCGQGCSGAVFLPLLFLAGDPEESPPDVYDPGFPPGESKFIEALYGTGPDTSQDVFFAVGGLGLLVVVCLTLAVVVLLAHPTSHRWFVPRSAAGAPRPVGPPAPAAFVLPPGYMICPDPRVHGAPPPFAPPPPPMGTPAPHPVPAPAHQDPAPPSAGGAAGPPSGDATRSTPAAGGTAPPPADPTAPGI